MSGQIDRNEQALALCRKPGCRITRWPHGYSIIGGWFFDRDELTPATIQALDRLAQEPGVNPTRPRPRRYVSRRRSSAAAGLALAYGAMAETVDRVNGQPGPMTWDELEQEKLNFAARVEAARKGQ